jgi:hypothetical protein
MKINKKYYQIFLQFVLLHLQQNLMSGFQPLFYFEYATIFCSIKTKLCVWQLLLSRCHNREPPEEEEKEADNLCPSIAPYCPSGNPDGAAVALCSAMTLVNRYFVYIFQLTLISIKCDISTGIVQNCPVIHSPD